MLHRAPFRTRSPRGDWCRARQRAKLRAVGLEQQTRQGSGSGGGARPRGRARRSLAWSAAGLALAAAAALLYPRPPLPFRTPARAPGDAPELSLLVLGDTGKLRALAALRSGQLAVARALVEEDLRQPADLLLLLGDNFYPSGLEREELVLRVRENLVRPYCRFVDLSGPRSQEVAAACDLPGALRRAAPVPMLAVLGNHDHKAPESPELQRSELPRFLPNWRLAESPVELRELAPGLSLVLVDSPAIENEAAARAVRAALERAPGPWRILALHEPFAAPLAPVPWPSSALLRRALAGLRVPVQLVLTGHNHALQVARSRDPFDSLHVMVGSGSSDRVIDHRFDGELLALSRTGFARVDWRRGAEANGSGAAGALEITVFETASVPALFFLGPRPVGRWRIEEGGRIHGETGAP